MISFKHIGLYFRLVFLACIVIALLLAIAGTLVFSPLWLSIIWIYKWQVLATSILLKYTPVGTFIVWAVNVLYYAVIYENGSFHKFLYDLLIELYPQKVLLNMNYGFATIDEDSFNDDGIFLTEL